MLAKSEWKDESLSYEPITDIISTPNAKQTWVHLTLDNGNTITTTDGHPFNTPEGWRNAILLKKGGQLLLKGEEGEPKTITITNISIETKHQTTYNLEVANAHTFFVGENGVLVHNAMSLCEYKQHLRKWDKSTFDTLADSIRYHAEKHADNDVHKYLRQASNFNKRGATHTYRASDNTDIWRRKSGEFLQERNGKIVTYGKK